MDLQQIFRADWLGLNAAARRNALVAAAAALRRTDEHADVEQTLRAARRPELRRAL